MNVCVVHSRPVFRPIATSREHNHPSVTGHYWGAAPGFLAHIWVMGVDERLLAMVREDSDSNLRFDAAPLDLI